MLKILLTCSSDQAMNSFGNTVKIIKDRCQPHGIIIITAIANWIIAAHVLFHFNDIAQYQGGWQNQHQLMHHLHAFTYARAIMISSAGLLIQQSIRPIILYKGFLCECTHIHMPIHTQKHKHTHKYAHTCAYMYARTHTHTYIQTHIHTHTNKCTHIYTHNTCIHTRTYTMGTL